MSITIDYREHALINIWPATCEKEVVNLEIGDAIVQVPGNPDAKYVFERKTYADLISSINDGRYREQKQRMLSTYAPQQCTYIIEGAVDSSSATYQGMMTNTLFRDGMKIVRTDSPRDTVDWLVRFAEKIRAKPDVFVATNAEATTYVSCLKTKSKKISNITPQVCYILQLCQIPGVSQKVATEIAKVYPNLGLFMAAFGDDLKTREIKQKELCAINMVGMKKAAVILEYMLFSA